MGKPRKSWRPFEEARTFIKEQNIKNSKEWYAYCKSGQKPLDIPSFPWEVYDEWQSLGDWLGTGTVASHLRKFLTFEEARAYIRSLGLKKTSEWEAYCKSGKKPDNIPQDPRNLYGSQWQGMSDWLGSRGRAPRDLTGQRFGRLLVISYADKDRHGSRWNCKCDCGNSKVVSRRDLVKRDTQSCGCLWKEKRRLIVPNKKAVGESAFNQLYFNYKKSARERGYSFDLDRDTFQSLTSSNCFYCGIAPYLLAAKAKGTNGDYIYNGIDRIDNTLGYTIDNTRSCCKQCNIAKGVLTEEEFYCWLERLVHHSPRLIEAYTAARSARF